MGRGAGLALKPLWLRHFYLCDKHPTKFEHLEKLRGTYPGNDVQLFFGDFNTVVHDVLNPQVIDAKGCHSACLTSRRFSASGRRLKKLASFKAEAKNKIEIFYFLAEWWIYQAIYQALGGIKSEAGEKRVEAWWGRPDWRDLPSMSGVDRAQLMAERFMKELGYGYAKPYAIYEKSEGGGHVAYYMIHATDHHRAPALMSAAYKEERRRRTGRRVMRDRGRVEWLSRFHKIKVPDPDPKSGSP